MPRILLSIILIFAPLCSMRAQILVPILAGNAPAGGNTPTLITSTCAVGNPIGTLNTTGANFIVGIEAFYQPGSSAVTDNMGNGSATLLTQHAVTGDTASQIFYWTNPTVGAGHSFNFGYSFGMACIFAYSGMQTTSVLDAGTDSGSGAGAANCTVGSITLSTNDLVVTGVAFGTAGTLPSAPTGYTLEPTVGAINFAGGSNYGGAGATRVQNSGTTNPTWTTPGDSACSIAAFKIM